MKQVIEKMVQAETEAQKIIKDAEQEALKIREQAQQKARADAEKQLQKAYSEAHQLVQTETEKADNAFREALAKTEAELPSLDSIPAADRDRAVQAVIDAVLAIPKTSGSP